ncbi:MAG: hypothetical protein MI919_28205 [Holophagales bacterium]|nr:hypothetical protein [Holophagales bacterium]
MIAPLRRRHRRVITLLAVALPVLVVLALGARPEPPVAEPLLDGPVVPGTPPVASVMLGGDSAESPPIEGMIRRHAEVLELELGLPLRHPDVLAYWLEDPTGDSAGAGSAPAASGIPAEAYLLGPVTARRVNVYRLPEASGGRAGRLLLYSLGHQLRLAEAAVPAGVRSNPGSGGAS